VGFFLPAYACPSLCTVHMYTVSWMCIYYMWLFTIAWDFDYNYPSSYIILNFSRLILLSWIINDRNNVIKKILEFPVQGIWCYQFRQPCPSWPYISMILHSEHCFCKLAWLTASSIWNFCAAKNVLLKVHFTGFY